MTKTRQESGRSADGTARGHLARLGAALPGPGVLGVLSVAATAGSLVSAAGIGAVEGADSVAPAAAMTLGGLAGLVTAGSLAGRPLALRRLRPPTRAWTAGIGAVLLLWCAGGLVFDLIRAGVGEPVDAVGAAVRLVALAAGVLLAATALAARSRSGSERAGSRPVRWPGYAAAVLALPYAVLKTAWALGSTVGLTDPDEVVELMAGQGVAAWVAGWGTVLLALAGSAIGLGLAHRPRHALVAAAVRAAGWVGAVVLVSTGLTATWLTVGSLAGSADAGGESGPIADWVYLLVYADFALWGLALLLACLRCRPARTPGRVGARTGRGVGLTTLGG